MKKRRNEEMKNFASLRAYYRIVNAFAVNLTIMKITNYKQHRQTQGLPLRIYKNVYQA